MTAPRPASAADDHRHAAAGPDLGEVSIGDLLTAVTSDLSTLLRQEVALAKAEVKTEVGKAGKGAGMLGGAGFAGYMVALFLSFGLWWGLASVMPIGWAAVIVAVLWAVVGAVLYTSGRKAFRQVDPTPQRTVDTVKQIPDAVKGNEATAGNPGDIR